MPSVKASQTRLARIAKASKGHKTGAGIAARERPNYCPPASPPARQVLQMIGASPSGKAADFDSAMRRFESSRPSQYFQ
jgi:hypothetical protein